MKLQDDYIQEADPTDEEHEKNLELIVNERLEDLHSRLLTVATPEELDWYIEQSKPEEEESTEPHHIWKVTTVNTVPSSSVTLNSGSGRKRGWR